MLAGDGRSHAVVDERRCSRWQKEMLLLASGVAVAGKMRCSCWEEETQLLTRGNTVASKRRRREVREVRERGERERGERERGERERIVKQVTRTKTLISDFDIRL